MTKAVQNLGLLDNPRLYMMRVQLCNACGGIAYELAEALSGSAQRYALIPSTATCQNFFGLMFWERTAQRAC